MGKLVDVSIGALESSELSLGDMSGVGSIVGHSPKFIRSNEGFVESSGLTGPISGETESSSFSMT